MATLRSPFSAAAGLGASPCPTRGPRRPAAVARRPFARASVSSARTRPRRRAAPPPRRRLERPPVGPTPRLRRGDAFPRASASSTSASASLPPPPPTSPAHRRASLARVALGLALLDAYLRAVTLACAAAGVASAPLVVGLVGLTLALLFAPRGVERALTSALEPAVRAVDAKIACVFIPYITAVPASNLPAGAHLCAAAVACAAGYLATMCIAGHVAQAFTVEDDESGGAKDEATGGSSARGAKEESARGPGKAGEVALARAADEKKPPPPPEALWVAAAAILAAAGAAVSRFAPRDVSFSVAFAPSYLAATVATYLASTRVPARLQRVGLFPTITGGVAMALVSAGVGAATGAGAIGGIREYCDGAGRVLLYFVPPAVLGLAFRVKAQRRALEANFAAVAVAVAVAVPGGFAVAAALGRALGLPAWLTLATVPKCTTTGLAVSMAAQIGADPSLVAAGCALSGTAGLAAGRALMDLAGVRGAVPRGVATGCSSHAAGTAGLAAGGEEEAAAVSGVAFAFAGVLGVALLEWGACRAALGVIAGAPVGA